MLAIVYGLDISSLLFSAGESDAIESSTSSNLIWNMESSSSIIEFASTTEIALESSTWVYTTIESTVSTSTIQIDTSSELSETSSTIDAIGTTSQDSSSSELNTSQMSTTVLVDTSTSSTFQMVVSSSSSAFDISDSVTVSIPEATSTATSLDATNKNSLDISSSEIDTKEIQGHTTLQSTISSSVAEPWTNIWTSNTYASNTQTDMESASTLLLQSVESQIESTESEVNTDVISSNLDRCSCRKHLVEFLLELRLTNVIV
eukprot:NODE_436_length_7460_cov_0.466105.p4 type:complete len:261 gc:universal NODE_436_length_7460_cov_0.466105:5770-4988(-)